MRVACCQLDIAWEDKRANFARVRELVIEEAKSSEINALLLDEGLIAPGEELSPGLVTYYRNKPGVRAAIREAKPWHIPPSHACPACDAPHTANGMPERASRLSRTELNRL